MTTEHGIRYSNASRAFIEHKDALRVGPILVGTDVLAVHISRIAQEKKRHHG